MNQVYYEEYTSGQPDRRNLNGWFDVAIEESRGYDINE